MTKLQERREALGLSQYELSKRTGISKSYISMLESGQRDTEGLTVRKLRKLAFTLGLDDFNELL